MKILVISDLHLTDKFNQKKYNKLVDIISNYEKVIINGDFWDSYHITFNDFINSKWNKLFPLLKEKNTIYIYGNHDLKRKCNEQVNLFSIEQDIVYEFEWNNKLIHVEHGNIIIPGFMEKNAHLENNEIIFSILKLAHTIKEALLNKLLSPEKIYASMHNNFKRKVLELKNENEIWICAHTHVQDTDLKNNYFNSGVCDHGRLQYLEINDKEIKAFSENF